MKLGQDHWVSSLTLYIVFSIKWCICSSTSKRYEVITLTSPFCFRDLATSKLAHGSSSIGLDLQIIVVHMWLKNERSSSKRFEVNAPASHLGLRDLVTLKLSRGYCILKLVLCTCGENNVCHSYIVLAEIIKYVLNPEIFQNNLDLVQSQLCMSHIYIITERDGCGGRCV